MELLREKIVLNKHIGREMTQVLLEGDIIVPDVKPDIASVLKTDAQIVISKVNPTTNRVSYSGKLAIKILYMAKNGDVSVQSIASAAAVDDFLNMEGIAPGTWVDLAASIANVDYRVVNDRKLNYRAVVDVVVSAHENFEVSMVKGVQGLAATQQRSADFVINSLVEKKSEEFTVRDEIALPANKPAVSELLQTGISIANKDVRMFNGRVDVSGELVVTPLYKGDGDDSLIAFEEFVLPFSGSLDVAAAKEGGFADVSLMALDSMVSVGPNAEGEDRILNVETIIGADIKIFENQELTVLEDAYAIDQKLNVKKAGLDYTRPICRNKNQFNLKEIVSPDGAPEILQIMKVSGVAHLEDVKVVEDKVVVEGVVAADILYVANSDVAPLYNHNVMLPIRQVVETKGAQPGMDAHVEHSVDHIGFNMMSSNEVELRFLLSLNTVVREGVKAEYIKDIEFSPIDREEMNLMPSMVVLTVDKNDTLWGVAKKYSTSIEELAAVNEIDSTAALKTGQRLIVVKKVMDEEN